MSAVTDLGERTPVSPALLAVLASRAGATTGSTVPRVMRGAAAARATTSGFASVDDLHDPLTAVERLASLSGAERARVASIAEQGYEDGLRRGHADGFAAGRDEAIGEIAARAALALNALNAAAAGLERRDAVALNELDDQVAGFAIDIVESLLGREVSTATDPGRDAIARALSFVPDRGTLIARLHPADLALIDSVEDLAPGREVQLVADAGIEPGGCIVDVGACRVDAQITPAIARLREVLGVASSPGGASTAAEAGQMP